MIQLEVLYEVFQFLYYKDISNCAIATRTTHLAVMAIRKEKLNKGTLTWLDAAPEEMIALRNHGVRMFAFELSVVPLGHDEVSLVVRNQNLIIRLTPNLEGEGNYVQKTVHVADAGEIFSPNIHATLVDGILTVGGSVYPQGLNNDQNQQETSVVID